jgi:hypothetical protein
MSSSLFAQQNQDTLFTDFDLKIYKPIDPTLQLIVERNYIRNIVDKKGVKKIEIVNVHKDSTTLSRKARLLNLNYGTVLAFDMLKDYGYEKVMFFGDRDYYYDTLFFIKDTLVFKEMVDDNVELVIVYPPKDDTLIVKFGNRNTRYDFLDKFTFRPAMKDYLKWMDDPYLDYVETYTLVKKDQAYEMIKAETTKDHISAHDYKRRREQFQNAGLSPFWISLFGIAIFKGL